MSILNLLFPRRCPFCRRFLRRGDARLCRECTSSLPFAEGGHAVIKNGEFFSACYAPLYYEKQVRGAIHRFKFSGRSGYAACFGDLCAACLNANGRPAVNLVTWVPISRKRRRKRGFDQAQKLAEAIGKSYYSIVEPVLEKTLDNPAQSSLKSGATRRANVLGAYEIANTSIVSDKRVLLVDDVITTGATLSECARMLLMAGAKDVICVTLAQTNINRAKKH